MKYALLEASDEEWSGLKKNYSDVNWNEILENIDNIDEMCDKMIDTIEDGVKRIMKLRDCKKPNTKSDGSAFQSSNMIPRNINFTQTPIILFKYESTNIQYLNLT